MHLKLLFVVVGAAAILVTLGLLYQSEFFAIPTPETFRTMQNLYLEPGQTEASNHPIMASQVAEIIIEPNSNGANTPDYELLVTMVDPSGETIMNKFISEPFHTKMRPAHYGWHAIIVTNVGDTGIAPGTSIESRPYDEVADDDVEIATQCIVPPSMKNENNTPFPWC
jgi:hypothetical protein